MIVPEFNRLSFNGIIYKFIFFILIVSISFYSGKITPVSPIYVIYLLIFLFSLFIIIFDDHLIITSDLLIIVLLLVHTFIVQFLKNNLINGSSLNLFIALIGYIIIRSFKNKVDLNSTIQLFKYGVNITLVVLLIDTFHRIMNPVTPDGLNTDSIINSSSWFYIYKYNTILFADSNTSALIVLILFFSILTINYYFATQKKYFKNHYFYTLIILLILSFSRAAIVGLIAGLIYFLVRFKLEKKYVQITNILLLIVASLFLSFVYFYYADDSSFQSKFYILELALTSYVDLDLSVQLFGIGLHKSKELFGIYSHILLITYLIEGGLISLILFITFFFIYSVKFNSIVFFPVMITGLSYFIYHGSPFLFTPLAFLANIMELSFVHTED